MKITAWAKQCLSQSRRHNHARWGAKNWWLDTDDYLSLRQTRTNCQAKLILIAISRYAKCRIISLWWLCCICVQGRDCEIDLNRCRSSPCLNGGTCTNGYGTIMCECPFGFAGHDCGLNMVACLSSPCQNGDCYVSTTTTSMLYNPCIVWCVYVLHRMHPMDSITATADQDTVALTATSI